MPDIIIRQPDDTEFEEVKKCVEEFWLDNKNMLKEQFLILLYKKKFAAFGRLKEHSDCSEMCTLGVVKKHRGNRFGTMIVKALLAIAKKEVYLVTVIPAYFKKLGFIYTEKYPVSLNKKVDMCSNHYHVGEEYKVMLYPPKSPSRGGLKNR